MIKQAVELGEFEITFQQRFVVQAQALVDFVVECTSSQMNSNTKVELWTLYVDGSSSNKGSCAGVVLIGPDNFQIEHALKFNFEGTNNMAEYETLSLGLCLITELKVKAI